MPNLFSRYVEPVFFGCGVVCCPLYYIVAHKKHYIIQWIDQSVLVPSVGQSISWSVNQLVSQSVGQSLGRQSASWSVTQFVSSVSWSVGRLPPPPTDWRKTDGLTAWRSDWLIADRSTGGAPALIPRLRAALWTARKRPDWLTDWPTNRLTDWLTDGLTDWLTD